MKTFCIWAVVLLSLFLIGQVRIGVRATYQEEGLALWARVGKLRSRVFPRPKKHPDTQKADAKLNSRSRRSKKEPVSKEPPPMAERVGGAVEYAKALLPIVLEAAGQFKRKLRVDTLHLVLTAGGSDPGDAAMLYGQANMVLGTFWYPLTEALQVKDGDARVALDFDAPGMTICADAALSLKIGQILWLGIYFGRKGLRAFLRVHNRQKKLKQTGKAA